MFFLPDYNARDDAKKARVEFARALGAYIDLVALERNSGSGSRQAMEAAAEIGDSWVFRRLGEELARSRWSGQAPWEALHGLADELGRLTGVTVRIGDPLGRVAVGKRLVAPDQVGSLAVAIGLGIED
jgi:hypothetical protein